MVELSYRIVTSDSGEYDKEMSSDVFQNLPMWLNRTLIFEYRLKLASCFPNCYQSFCFISFSAQPSTPANVQGDVPRPEYYALSH